MPSLISRLSGTQRRQLLDDLNYLNMAEIKSFCDRHSIPYKIWIDTADGRLRRAPDSDRKGIVLRRIRHYLQTGEIQGPTRFPASIVCFEDSAKEFSASDRFLYGRYDKKNRALMGLLQSLTGGRFRDGAIARILAMKFWSEGKAPTFEEYAAAWLQAVNDHTRPDPEAAYLSDLAAGTATDDWKQLRKEKANAVLRILARINPPAIRRK